MKKHLVLLVIIPFLFLLSACASEVDKALDDFNSSSESVRNAAVDKITQIEPLPIEKLISIVVADSNRKEITQQMKECAAQALIQIGDPAIEPVLNEYGKHIHIMPEGITRILVSLKNERIVSFLIDIIHNSPDTSLSDIQQMAVVTLAEIGGQQASDVVYEQFLKWAVNKPEEDNYNKAVIMAMGKIGDERAVNELFKVITNEDYVKAGRYDYENAKYAAFDALTQNPENFKAFIQFYRQYCNDSDKTKRDDALYAKAMAKKLFENIFKNADGLFKEIPLDGTLDNTIKPGKLIVVYKHNPPITDSEGKELTLSTDLDTYLLTPEEYLCEAPEEAETIAFITSYTTIVGTYDDGANALSLSAAVTVVDRETKNVIARSGEFVSGPPPAKTHSGPGIGSMPTDQIIEFISNLYKASKD